VLDGNGAVALAQQIESAIAAMTPQPPDPVTSAVSEIATDREALQQALGAQTAPDDRPEVRSIEILEDAGWGMLRDFLLVFERSGSTPPA
jgi:hypothetical protein